MSHRRIPHRCTVLIPLTRHPPPPLLLFLYQTRSIHSDRDRRSDDEAIPFDKTPSGRGTAADPFAYLYVPPRPVSQRGPTRRDGTQPDHHNAAQRTRYVPVDPQHKIQEQQKEQYHRSSITLREREIFTRIFESILSTPAPKTKVQTPAESNSHQLQGHTLPPPPALTELFTNTIGPQQEGSSLSFAPRQLVSQREGAAEAMKLASKIESFPLSLRAAAARAAGLRDWGISKNEATVNSVTLEALKREIRGRKNDASVLRWMEENVFVLPMNTAAPHSALYPELLAEGMDVFRNVYNDIGSVVAIFERAKSLGAESYVLGCTGPVYNRALAAVWDGFGDLQRVRDLVEEMRVNAVGGDLDTVEVIRRVCRDVEGAFDGQRGELAAVMVGKPEMKIVDVLQARASRLERFGSLDKLPQQNIKKEKKRLSPIRRGNEQRRDEHKTGYKQQGKYQERQNYSGRRQGVIRKTIY